MNRMKASSASFVRTSAVRSFVMAQSNPYLIKIGFNLPASRPSLRFRTEGFGTQSLAAKTTFSSMTMATTTTTARKIMLQKRSLHSGIRPMRSCTLSQSPLRSLRSTPCLSFHCLVPATKIPRIRHSSSSSSSSTTKTETAVAAVESTEGASAAAAESTSSSSSYFGALLRRLACSLGIVYVVTEYGFEWTVCEGPSMMPTIQPRGEIVLIDRLTPRLWGLAGGDTAEKRTRSARTAQEKHERRLRQLRRRNDFPEDKDVVVTWHEPRIPINRLPPGEAWDRLRHQLSTGISVGDVVVLQHPDRIGTVCKRVMGLPGDVVMKPSSRLAADRLQSHLTGKDEQKRDETEPQRRRWIRRAIRSSGTVVPDGHLWVEGDNPWNSSDSRSYGAVPAALVMGRVVCRLWPHRGNAILERGDRPLRDNAPSLAFSGSLVIPAGWDNQKIVKDLPTSGGSGGKDGKEHGT
mmetsp:Transcript_17701/g.49002  ORF Transcript_17701/g.49002 Transcript_17701/m.49002 type:complete len:463 (-) Transcript_17701:1792-3180(-)